MAAIVDSIKRNLLLAALHSKDSTRFLDCSTIVTLKSGAVVFDSGDRVRYVYFPITGALSLSATTDDHSSLQVAMVGSEGVCGLAETSGGQNASVRALAVFDCEAMRVTNADFAHLMSLSPSLSVLLTQYVSVRFAQLAQTVACTHFHVVGQRLARWLLTARDRLQCNDFEATHELLSHMLGVRRVGVSASAAAFKTRGLIDYSRGRIEITDRLALEAEACACYANDLQFYRRGMSGRAVPRR